MVATKQRNTLLALSTALFGLVLALSVASCSKDHSLDSVLNDSDPNVSGVTPPVPTGLYAEVSSRSIRLFWALSDSSAASQVSKYRVYSQRVGETSEALIDSAAAPPLIVRSLDNGADYRLRVSSVLSNGLEGRRSSSITVQPAVFSVLINDGAESTNSTRVTLNLQGPSGTQGIRISNRADNLALVGVRPAAANVSWNLDPVDGLHTVYVQFVDVAGNLSSVLSDEIELDRRAEIASVSFSPASATPGQVVALRLDAGEPFGNAEVRLGSGPRVELRDDGGGGDTAADDGVYALDYLLEQNVELFQVQVTGFFTDRAGNSAEPRLAPGRLTVHQDPTAVTLSPLFSPGPQELRLNWSLAVDEDRFGAYRVVRDTRPNVANNATATERTRIANRNTTEYTDTNLDPSKTYYYVVLVEDDFGNRVASNEVSGQPLANEPPDPVILDQPSEVTETSITLQFSRSFASDFARYRVVRGFQANLDTDPDRRVVSTITTISETRYVDRTEIEENRTYFYRIEVVDQLGAFSSSNIVSAMTPDRLPSPSELATPGSVGETSVLLRWSANNDGDFDRYELRRGTSAGIDESDPVLATVTTQEQVSYLDRNLIENTRYFYRLFVVDRGGNRAGSEELAVTTANANPAPVTLNAPTETIGAANPTLVLSWSASTAHDFEEYRLYRDTSPAVSQASTLVRTVASAGVVSYTDDDLNDNVRYYYRVFVIDEAGGVAGSNERSVVTENRPPTPVSLSVSATTPTSISLNWTANNDPDFDRYRLLRGTSNSNLSTIVVELFQRGQTGHTVFVAESDSSTIFFKVQVFDDDIDSSGSLSTDSNVVSARVP